ncbi:MAG: diacylglycerol kinase family lipid kinase [Pyrinomonadaceae bacterium]|nr:diacylglycerol kinase family lipid kinase [Pyrinomonadaceae bacterium]
MQTLPLVIVNPASARGTTGREWPSLAHALATHFGPFNCAFTTSAGESTIIAAREARAGRRFIIACGGDGTINEVANGILEAGAEGTELGILPSGTGGDFRRTLRVPSRANDAARLLRTGRTRTIDAGRVTYVNHAGETESRFFLGVSSCGLSGKVIEHVKRDKGVWIPGSLGSRIPGGGKLSFAAATLRSTLSSDNTDVLIKLDDRAERRLRVANFCVANARYFGGGMKIAPDAKINDGRFDCIVIGDLSAIDILSNGYKLYTGAHLNLEQVYQAHARVVSIRPAKAAEHVALEVDGELPGRLPASFEILPNALRVRCPA